MRKFLLLITIIGISYNLLGQITIDATNNAGIGTSTPAAKLDVAGGNIISQQILYARHIDGKDWNNNSTNGDLYLQWNNYTKNTYINPRGGNVGIGTSTPDNTNSWTTVLDVYGATMSKSMVTTNTVKTGIWSHNSGYYGAPAGGIIGTYSTHPFTIITNKTPRITVLSNGHIGLGTTTPQQQVDIKGYVRIETSSSYGIVGVNIGSFYGTSILDPFEDNLGNLGYLKKWGGIRVTNLYATNTYVLPSDENAKENIQDLKDGITLIQKLRPVKYNIKPAFFASKNEKSTFKVSKLQMENQMGLIAQEIQKIIPEAVSFDSTSQMYGVNYVCLIPLLISAIQDQQNQLNELGKDKTIKKISVLFQVDPISVEKNITIDYIIDESVKKANIYLYNNGKQLQSIAINKFGKGQIILNGSEFQSGMYFYALVVDGKEVDNKHFLVTE